MNTHANNKKRHWMRGLIVIATVFTVVFVILMLSRLFPNEIDAAYYDEAKSYTVTENMYIEALPEPVPFDGPKDIENIGSVSCKQALVADGRQSLLFPTFDDREAVFLNLRAEIFMLLSRIKLDFDMETINEQNYEEYRDAGAGYLALMQETGERDPDMETEIGILHDTVSILENHSKNALIIQYLVKSNPVLPGKLFKMMPEDSAYSQNYREEHGLPMIQGPQSSAVQ